jgi:hypothetical protein
VENQPRQAAASRRPGLRVRVRLDYRALAG